ncbi:BadF/BadG/BcrA/BcrD ATPase family protein [Nonomuraea sp. NPDC005692]|uniref:BadF/BadG/BcrA/BcrD ATPase family protein n=1 Tax=Nonomuraea sp. NPDC005692 TaxID=3157168 RepID=UPI00340EBCA2
MLFAGVDAGGTTTRAAVHAADGTRLGHGTAGPGNPAAHGPAAARLAIGQALRRALDGLDPALVAASVAGVAGGDDAFAATLGRTWAECGIAVPPRMVGDVEIAYAAGTAAPSGTLLLAGTGAAAARFSGRTVTAVADGLGWLLGDEGGGFWIGRAGVRAAVRALDRPGDDPEVRLPDHPDHTRDRAEGRMGRAPGAGLAYEPLVDLVSAHFGVAGEPRRRADRIVRLAQADRMLVAAAAPLVSRAAAAGDERAAGIVAEAARRLTATAARLSGDGPLVLAGGVLTTDGPVRAAVLARLAGRQVRTARDATAGACWLAALDRLGDEAAHERFTALAPPR